MEYSYEEALCGDNGVTYPLVVVFLYCLFGATNSFILHRSKCFLEYEACTRQVNIKPVHMGQCDNCRNIVCPFNGQCLSDQRNYSCICPTKNSCPIIRVC